jgi:hypothetical protein
LNWLALCKAMESGRIVLIGMDDNGSKIVGEDESAVV